MSELITSTRGLVLDRLADGKPSDEILADLCLAFEAAKPGTKAGITILDRDQATFERAIFPSLAPTYAEALKGAVVAERPGSCALAVAEGRTVVSTDVAGDTRFAAQWRELGAEHGVEALVSVPILRSDRSSLGTFVVVYPLHFELQSADFDTADAFAALAEMVLSTPQSGAEPAAVQV